MKGIRKNPLGNQTVGHIIKALILSFFVTAMLIVIFAFVMFKLRISEDIIAAAVTFIYIISCALGGFYIGRVMKEKKFMWGFLVGLCYLLVLVVASIIISGGINILSAKGLSLFLLCTGGGTLGGMLA